jgi:hypothetical protein
VVAADVDSVKGWFRRYQHAIYAPERRYLETGDDLIYVLPKFRRPWLQSIFCYLLVNTFKTFRRSPTDQIAYDEEIMIFQNKPRADFLLGLIIVPFGLFMLIGPLWILYVEADAKARLGVITAFIIAFAALVFLTTGAKTYDGLAATAG